MRSTKLPRNLRPRPFPCTFLRNTTSKFAAQPENSGQSTLRAQGPLHSVRPVHARRTACSTVKPALPGSWGAARHVRRVQCGKASDADDGPQSRGVLRLMSVRTYAVLVAVELREITDRNRHEVLGLRLAPGQDRFIGTV